MYGLLQVWRTMKAIKEIKQAIVHITDDGEVKPISAIIPLEDLNNMADVLKDVREQLEYWHANAEEYEAELKRYKGMA